MTLVEIDHFPAAKGREKKASCTAHCEMVPESTNVGREAAIYGHGGLEPHLRGSHAVYSNSSFPAEPRIKVSSEESRAIDDPSLRA